MLEKALKQKSNRSLISSDGSMILNLAGKVSLLKVMELEISKIYEFSELKNPSYGTFSSDLSMIAYKNTAGKIAVHDVKSGDLKFKHNAVKYEGNMLYFVNNNKKILSSTWACEIFTIDISNGDTTKLIIGDGEYFDAPIIPGLLNNEFFVCCSERHIYGGNLHVYKSKLYKLYLTESDMHYEPICELPQCDGISPVKLQNSLFFSSRKNASSSSSVIYIYDMEKNVYNEYLDIHKIYSLISGEESRDVLRVKHISGSANEIYLFLVIESLSEIYSPTDTIMIIERKSKKCIKILKHNFISNVLLFNEDKHLWVGTWERVYIYDFQSLVNEQDKEV